MFSIKDTKLNSATRENNNYNFYKKIKQTRLGHVCICTRGSVVVDCTPSNAFPLPCLFPVAIITMEQKEKACQHSKVAKL